MTFQFWELVEEGPEAEGLFADYIAALDFLHKNISKMRLFDINQIKEGFIQHKRAIKYQTYNLTQCIKFVRFISVNALHHFI